MDFVVKRGSAAKVKSNFLVAGVFEGKSSKGIAGELDQLTGGLLRKAVKSGEFKGSAGQSFMVAPASGSGARRLLFVGLGSEAKCENEIVRRAIGGAVQKAREAHCPDIALAFDSFNLKKVSVPDRARILGEGAILGGYRFDRYLTDEEAKKSVAPEKMTLVVSSGQDESEVAAGIDAAQAICAGVVLARDLVNEPGNIKSPDFLARQAAASGKTSGFKCTILEKAAIEKEQMGALLGVAQGSEREPRLIVMEYSGGKKGGAPVALVGKGVVFDSGGISIKPSEGMDEMKMDMGGGAAVIGAMTAAARLELPINLIGIVPAVENMPSGSAIRPGDILTSASGKTIEVLNTDAEGRLILADALSYAARYKPKTVIDLATLTGACIIALGHHATAVLGNDDKLVKDLLAAGTRAGEKAWQLPLWPEYAEQIKSDVADVKNVGGRPAGTITAAAFLQKFADEYSWAHLDIAGTAWAESAKPCYPKGGTGVGVRLLIEYLKAIV
ncbi:MAG: leucyl aminopeptidase [Desulfuromonas sp.]|nr:MAG: leucyl aminopeptidase [Desulfuromonas sp.]